jgi:hypothetical protein
LPSFGSVPGATKPNIQIALIEAKDNNHDVGDGIQQGLDYSATLNIPFVFSSNGDGFVFHDRTGQSATIEANLGLDAFPSPADLRTRYCAWKGLDTEAERIVLQDYFDDGSGKAPRYYQVNAVNAAIEAIANGQDRVLLVMATGTGKTYTAFQIIWRLWKAGRKKRILFLADRNVLVDQTMVNDFRPFGAAMAKLSTNAKTIERQDGQQSRSDVGNRQEAPDRHRLRDLSRALSGDYRVGGAREALSRILARLLRSDRDRRMPSRQRGRGFGLAGNPRSFFRRDADRPHRHAESRNSRCDFMRRSKRGTARLPARPWRVFSYPISRCATAGVAMR